MTTKFTPLHDRILVRRVEEAGTTRGGLIIPDSAKDKPQEGTVISVGKGKTNDEGKLFPLAVKEGDSILFGKYSGTEIKLDGDDAEGLQRTYVVGKHKSIFIYEEGIEIPPSFLFGGGSRKTDI